MATSHLSLIIPVYNRPNEVEELLDSLTRQSETNFEVVIVEDGSKETCQHVVEAFKDKLDVSYSYIPNGGPGNARNYGAKQSKGDYLIVLDSDCILPPDYIKSVNKELKETGADAFGGPDKASDSFTDVSVRRLLPHALRGRYRFQYPPIQERLQSMPVSLGLGISQETYGLAQVLPPGL